MIEQLFGSKTRVKLLQLFYTNPNRSFYVREITRKVDEQINSVRRELANLLSVGIITSDTNNNRLYYEVNQTHEFFIPFSQVFGGRKITAAAAPVASAVGDEQPGEAVAAPAPAVAVSNDPAIAALKKVGNIDLALLTGQFTRDMSSGIDFLIVGDVNQTKLDKYVAELEKSEAKQINYSVFGVDEFEYRRRVHDKFIAKILAAKVQVLIDKHAVIAAQVTE